VLSRNLFDPLAYLEHQVRLVKDGWIVLDGMGRQSREKFPRNLHSAYRIKKGVQSQSLEPLK
jgi:hypothetical protein